MLLYIHFNVCMILVIFNTGVHLCVYFLPLHFKTNVMWITNKYITSLIYKPMLAIYDMLFV